MTEKRLETLLGADASPMRDVRIGASFAPGFSNAGQGAAPAVNTSKRGVTRQSSYAGYLFGGAGSDEKPAWSDSAKGRATIRLLSRGVVGAAFFTYGGHVARKQLSGYESWKKPENLLQHVAKFFDHTVGHGLETAAYHFTPGDIKTKAKAAWQITNFRSKTFTAVAASGPAGKTFPYYTDRWGQRQPLNGRGLGAEMVTVTFDFFMASIGDALTRNIVQGLDPNVKQSFMLDDKGQATTWKKGHFSPTKFVQEVGRTGFRILTKNAGEDWAAALPYVYQMKWQRQVLAKIFPGFKISSDHSWNGGMSRVILKDDPARGLKAGQVVGSYSLAGVIDLQARFTGYNWYTLMYRELYDSVANGIDKWRHDELHFTIPSNPISSAVHGVGYGMRYALKSFIKANIYMNPAVPLFWMFRTPQSKWRSGYAVDGIATAADGSEHARNSSLLTTKPVARAQLNGHDPVFLANTADGLFAQARLIHDEKRPTTLYYGQQAVDLKSLDKNVQTIASIDHPYRFTGVRRSFMGHLLNPFGWVCFQGGSALTHAVDYITGSKTSHTIDPVTWHMHKDVFFKELAKKVGPGLAKMGVPDKAALLEAHPELLKTLLREREKTLRNFVDASFAYTPYMWAKAETALRVDDRRGVGELGHMDKAIYRFIDSAFSFDGSGMKQAGRDIGRLAVNFEKDVKSREGGALTDGENDNLPPVSKVEGQSVALQGKQAVSLAQPRAANDSHQPAANSNSVDAQKWAKTVAGGRAASLHPTHPTMQ